jgi:hypothetical protein
VDEKPGFLGLEMLNDWLHFFFFRRASNFCSASIPIMVDKCVTAQPVRPLPHGSQRTIIGFSDEQHGGSGR